jgi:hypothetical protein
LRCGSVFASGNCSGQPDIYDGPDCSNLLGGGTGPGCTSPQTCESADDIPDAFCCLNVTAVPELPSWFGPFSLALGVAGWEYIRLRKKHENKPHVIS